jgi:hypothetical protein
VKVSTGIIAACALSSLASCATAGKVQEAPASAEGDPRTSAGPAIDTSDITENEPLLDRTQKTVYNIVNNSSKWFDGFFGATETDRRENVSRGRVSAGAFWDERDGGRERFRMKARIPLPAAKRRADLVFGRGDVDDFVDGAESSGVDSLPDRFNDFEDDDWLLGVGYSRRGGVASGWHFGVGVRLASPLEPYTRATYRWNRNFGDAWLWRMQPRVFWQNQRGFGASYTSIVDYAHNANWLFRSWTNLQGEDEIEGLGWRQQFIAYQALSSKDALSYSVFARGETSNEVPLLDYGIELRYRKRIAREWFFLILSSRLNWPREFTFEERNSNFGIGVEFEMQFGDWPGRKQQ